MRRKGAAWCTMPSKPLQIYVAGPLTGGLVATNITNAIIAGLRLRRAGWTPIIPHLFFFAEVAAQLNDEEFWLGWDFDLVRNCVALCRLPGVSKGSDREVAVALELGLAVFFGVEAACLAEAVRS